MLLLYVLKDVTGQSPGLYQVTLISVEWFGWIRQLLRLPEKMSLHGPSFQACLDNESLKFHTIYEQNNNMGRTESMFVFYYSYFRFIHASAYQINWLVLVQVHLIRIIVILLTLFTTWCGELTAIFRLWNLFISYISGGSVIDPLLIRPSIKSDYGSRVIRELSTTLMHRASRINVFVYCGIRTF